MLAPSRAEWVESVRESGSRLWLVTGRKHGTPGEYLDSLAKLAAMFSDNPQNIRRALTSGHYDGVQINVQSLSRDVQARLQQLEKAQARRLTRDEAKIERTARRERAHRLWVNTLLLRQKRLDLRASAAAARHALRLQREKDKVQRKTERIKKQYERIQGKQRDYWSRLHRKWGGDIPQI
mgnify:CR=1 FL=1